MSGAKVGDAFVTHEFDEAIAIQRSIVEAGEALASVHPMADARRTIKASLTEDRRFLRQLESMGKAHDATGKAEDVAASLGTLMRETVRGAKDGADSDVYEAHAVLLALKRKQMDGASGMRRIATAIKDPAMQTSCIAFERAQRSSSVALSRDLAAFARKIATAPAG